MKPRSVLAGLGLAAVLSPAYSRGDEGEVSPPPVPAAQMPGPARVAPDPPQGWLPPQTPTASPQSITVPVAMAPATAPQLVTFQIQLVPAPSTMTVPTMPVTPTPALQVVHSRPPGPLGRMVGKVGQCLTIAGMTRLYIPTQEVQQVVYTPMQASPVQASPQAATLAAPRKGWLNR
jgi:hypothetical protein